MVEKELVSKDELSEVLEHIESGHNFLLSGGAGSGKTYSLVQVLQNISAMRPKAQIACITYTNAAAIEIKNRANIKNLRVSTIHDFLWDMISQFQKELKETLLELINDTESSIKNPTPEGVYDNSFENGIQYKEYVKIDNGIISHDEVLILANKMYKKYPRLCDLLIDSFEFVFVDEYQDTSELVIEILLDVLQMRKKANIIGFFGDSMQSIYETGIGHLNKYIDNKIVYKVEKSQNRRNPQAVIDIANKIRDDEMIQTPSNDITAPNMENGVVKQGSVKFLYSSDFDLEKVKLSKWVENWDFTNSEETKELRLTHNLIANEAGFSRLMEIYDNDPIMRFKGEFHKEAQKQNLEYSEEDTFEKVVKSISWTYKRGENKDREHLEVFLETPERQQLYNYVKEWPYEKVRKIYLDKETLLDNSVMNDGLMKREPKRDRLIQHLFKIQDIIFLSDNKNYNELIRRTSFDIQSIADKRELEERVNMLKCMSKDSIEKVINYANETKLCIMDDKFKAFIERNDYLYWRVKQIAFSEFQDLYNYLEGYMPFSTQHKIKGLEFKNVLVVLNNGGWNNYNFEYLFAPQTEETRNEAKKRTYLNILQRTKKLFYVCCTRAKENLVVYYPSPTTSVLEGACEIFGRENCINLDEETNC